MGQGTGLFGISGLLSSHFFSFDHFFLRSFLSSRVGLNFFMGGGGVGLLLSGWCLFLLILL